VHRTFVSNFHELRALLSSKVTFERNYALDSIEHPRLRFAFGTICGVSPPVSEADLRPRQRQSLAIGVEPQRHRRACTQRREQEFIRIWADIKPTHPYRPVRERAPEITSCWNRPLPVSRTTTVLGSLSSVTLSWVAIAEYSSFGMV
jgi:hypothetical protein